MILILYTTLYRLGGKEMAKAAAWMAKEKAKTSPDCLVHSVAIESKADFLAAIGDVPEPITELHFIGHSGLYGPMFGTTKMPDQMSRAEWAQLAIPFVKGATAHFHCCRSGRWFAPFFARRYGVPAYGNHSYTTFSHSPLHYEEVAADSTRPDVYVVSAPGMKGMGLRGAVRKRMGRCPTIPMARFEPSEETGDETYDGVAELYDAVFKDFRVRSDEWKWLTRNLPENANILDIGSGNGALLLALAPLIESGMGVDASRRMVEIARSRATGEHNLRFEQVAGPSLPIPDQSVDVVISMLSWRYLDWDPIVEEIKRVLRPGGRVLIVDMVVSPFHWHSAPRVLADRIRTIGHSLTHPDFRRSLRQLVRDTRWEHMLRHNPMRAQHEYRNYLPSRFPGGKVETLNLALRSEIIAFRWDSHATSESAQERTRLSGLHRMA